jgi:hypothetical protein
MPNSRRSKVEVVDEEQYSAGEEQYSTGQNLGPQEAAEKVLITDKPKPYSAASFKENVPVRLPSGHWVVLRPVSLGSLTRSGRIPNPLLPAAFRIAKMASVQPPVAAEADAMGEDNLESALASYFETVDVMTVAAVAQPPLVLKEEEEDDTCVWVGRLNDADKATILDYTQMSVSFLTQFREQYASEFGG